MGMNLIICGGREYALAESDVDFLNRLHNKYGFTLVIEGGCRRKDYRGDPLPTADYDGWRWARSHGIQTATMDANFTYYGKSGAPLRNAEMAKRGNMCVAFPGGRGTADMVAKAKGRGMPVYEHPFGGIA